ncbi:MAG TPA: hypothetical protein VNM24_05580 [Burkholderiales bacterium]|jgi:predicted Zn-dependent protease|nr:hypothetical protein [Burkholderiales bacterium]
MSNRAIRSFEALLARGKDNAVLRFSLGNEYFKLGDDRLAIGHLERATTLDPGYSAAWKLLGKARLRTGDAQGAQAAWQRGIEAAEARGDKQAAREMGVFLRRLTK